MTDLRITKRTDARKAKRNGDVLTITEAMRAFAECRVLGHSWRHGGRLEGTNAHGAYGFLSICDHCTTERRKYIVGSGRSAQARYKYPDGYARRGEDSLNGQQWRRVLIVSMGYE